MDDADYMRAQAQRCRRLAGSIFDAEAIAVLETMAREFEERAAELEAGCDD
jgi:hypothetical protein